MEDSLLEQIRDAIVIETKDIFLENDPTFKIKEIADLFIKVLTYKIEEPDLEGIATCTPEALKKVLLEKLTRIEKNVIFPQAVKIEPYLRKVLYLTNYDEYLHIKNNNKGLGDLIDKLNINYNNINFNWLNLYPNQKENYGEQLFITYNLRNIDAHHCKEWGNFQLYYKLSNVLVIYLLATYQHYSVLRLVTARYDFSEFLQKEIEHYKKWQRRFVHIEGKETFKQIELYAKEYIEDEDGSNLQQPSEGKIDDLRKQITGKHMVILGDLGMGKTTTLQYLAYKDAKEILRGNTQIACPVYLELKKLTRSNNDILQIVAKKLKIEDELFQKHLKDGKISLFLDSLNEIEKNIIQGVFTQIKNIINDYTDIIIIATIL
ncbi:NACHT domain-containing protein [Candidatus Riflebacteria bacterium]